jgi:uroporphyrinogen-III decarboxylase
MGTLVCLLDLFVYCITMYSCICTVAPQLGMQAEALEGPDVESNPKIELVDPSRR